MSRNVKSSFKVEKLHSIPKIRDLATHGNHEKYKREKKITMISFQAAAVM